MRLSNKDNFHYFSMMLEALGMREFEDKDEDEAKIGIGIGGPPSFPANLLSLVYPKWTHPATSTRTEAYNYRSTYRSCASALFTRCHSFCDAQSLAAPASSSSSFAHAPRRDHVTPAPTSLKPPCRPASDKIALPWSPPGLSPSPPLSLRRGARSEQSAHMVRKPYLHRECRLAQLG